MEPYLSIVAISRNDNHGGNLLERMQLFIDSLYIQANRYEVPIELILVEWNPPEEKPSLFDALNWPIDRRFIHTRIIQVPPEFHANLAHAENLPVFQMIGKNVGIRRARGKFVLVTNIDIIFSDSFWDIVKRRELKEGFEYRVDRVDVNTHVLNVPLEQIQKYCNDHVIRYNKKGMTISQSNNRSLNRKVLDFFITIRPKKVCEIKLFYLSCKGFEKVGSFISNFGLIFKEFYYKNQTFMKPLFEKISILINSFFNSFFFFKPKKFNKISPFSILNIFMHLYLLELKYGFPFLHYNGCGDFALMSRKDWENIRGYLENEVFSWNLDSLLLIDTYYLGITENYLINTYIYHIEHGKGSGWTPEGEEILFKRILDKGIPVFTWQNCLEYAANWKNSIEKKQRLNQLKIETWGFSNIYFHEYLVN